jgi:hypothetical protein
MSEIVIQQLKMQFDMTRINWKKWLRMWVEQEDRDFSQPQEPAFNPGHIGPQYSKNVKGGEEDESKQLHFLFFRV